jgi:hypothetical protein
MLKNEILVDYLFRDHYNVWKACKETKTQELKW